MKTQDAWYWVGNAVRGSVQEEEKVNLVTSDFRWSQKFSYWSANYGDRIAGSCYSLYVDKKLSWTVNSGGFDLYSGIGVSMRYRPVADNQSLNYQVPMYLARLALNANKNLFQSNWLKFRCYASGSYYKSVEEQDDDSWEVYSKVSWRSPDFLNSNLRLNFAYFGSEPSSKEWEYGEGKVQLLYSHHNLPVYIGWVPYTSANWQNTVGWITHSEARLDNFVVGLESSQIWLEVNFGTYYKKSGIKPEISHEGDERHLSFSVGTKL